MKLRKISDGISPDLLRKARAVSGGQRRKHLQAMGRSVISLAKRAFTDAGLRPTPWVARVDSLPHALLQKSTMLRKSIRVIKTSDDRVDLGSDRKYAAIHQYGGATGRKRRSKLPARPYMPFTASNKLTPAGKRAVDRALRASLRSAGL